jgi:predicted ester cyclase
MDVLARVRAQFQALETGDAELAITAVAPDWVDHEASFEQVLGPLRGPACLLAVGAWLRTGFPDLRFVEQTMVADDRHVVSAVLFTGRNTGPLVRFRDGRVAGVVPPTGRQVEVRHVHIHGLRDGDVVSHSAVRDDLGLLMQLGLLPSPPPSPSTGADEVIEEMRRAAASASAVRSAV